MQDIDEGCRHLSLLMSVCVTSVDLMSVEVMNLRKQHCLLQLIALHVLMLEKMFRVAVELYG